MQAETEYGALRDLIRWIDDHTAGLAFDATERNLLASGCFDVALEHQAAIALLYSSRLYGPAFALLRVLAESVVRGMWLLHCASEDELASFKHGKMNQTFDKLTKDVERAVGDTLQVLSGFKQTAWGSLNGFTHTGMHQVSRRHKPGRVEGNYPDDELAKALGVAGALGMIAALQLVGMAGNDELASKFLVRMNEYSKPSLAC